MYEKVCDSQKHTSLVNMLNKTSLTLFGLRGGGQNGPLRVFAKYLKNSSADLHETF